MSPRLDGARSILECLEHYATAAGGDDAYIFLVDGETRELRLSYGALRQRARALALELRERGLQGQAVLLLFPAGLDFIVAFFACLYAGAIAVPANLARGSHHFNRLRTIMLDSGCRTVLTLPALRELIHEGLTAAGVDTAACDILAEAHEEAPAVALDGTLAPASEDAVAFIQYTSGSTGDPKGVVVTHAQLIANERAIRQAAALPERMRGAGWLPQFHDMGLIGNLLQPLALGGCYAFMSPLHFIQSPLRWLAMLSRYRAFASAAPCFALEMCVEAMKNAPPQDWDLAALDTIFCGAEPISQATLESFHACLAPYGLGADVVKPCYGMAETTLIITGGLPRRAPRFLRVDREALQRGEARPAPAAAAATQDIVCCGQVVDGHSVAVVDPESRELLGDGKVGEIWCAGPSVAAGYWRKSQATLAAFAAYSACGQGPFLRTGDLGFRDGDGIYVTGRIKEMLIVRGRNHYPHDLEASIAAAFAERGLDVQVAVFQAGDQDGAAGVVACVELPRRIDAALHDERALAALARQAVSQAHDLRLDDVLLLKFGGIPRTSSGKTQRLLCAQLYRGGALQARRKAFTKPLIEKGSLTA